MGSYTCLCGVHLKGDNVFMKGQRELSLPAQVSFLTRFSNRVLFPPYFQLPHWSQPVAKFEQSSRQPVGQCLTALISHRSWFLFVDPFRNVCAVCTGWVRVPPAMGEN